MTVTRTNTDELHSLRERLAAARGRTDELFARLKPDALYERPIPERHRLVFYLGHLEAFDWNLVAKRGCGMPPFDEALDRLFAFGIDPVDGGLPNEPASSWPARAAVEAYGARVREAVDRCLEASDVSDPSSGMGQLFQCAIEHRLMHAETLAYLLHRLDHARKIAPPRAAVPIGRAALGTARIPAGRATLGLARAGGAFGWDNEYEAHTVDVPGFEIDVLPVTNAQWLEFMRAGGYDEPRLWAEPDWAWREREGVEHPAFWSRHGTEWAYRGMFDEVLLPPDHPVYVSLAEAHAFTRWAGGRLPTEAEFHRAAFGTPEGEERAYPWGETPPEPRRANADFAHWDPVPVGAHPDGDSAFGVADLVGNGWQWTSTPFAPFTGFERFPFYPGYSADFFDGKHFVMKGGSARTAACMLRRSFRNWFQPHYPYVYAGFRRVHA